ncbi:hypothetical protein ABK040_011064 [Willaertia magna]
MEEDNWPNTNIRNSEDIDSLNESIMDSNLDNQNNNNNSQIQTLEDPQNDPNHISNNEAFKIEEAIPQLTDLIEIINSQSGNKRLSTWTEAKVSVNGTIHQVRGATKFFRRLENFNDKWLEFKNRNKNNNKKRKVIEESSIEDIINKENVENIHFLCVDKKKNNIDTEEVKQLFKLKDNHISQEQGADDAVIIKTKNQETAKKLQEYNGNCFFIKPLNSDKDNIRTNWVKATFDNQKHTQESQCNHLEDQIETLFAKQKVNIINLCKIGYNLFKITSKTPEEAIMLCNNKQNIKIEDIDNINSEMEIAINRIDHIDMFTYYDIIISSKGKVDLSKE